MEDYTDALFAKIRKFGWDPGKRDWTIRERGIDFDEARHVFDGPTIVYRSDRKGEERYVVFGFLDDVEIAVVCSLRVDLCWIISARRASRNERKKYHHRLSRRAPSEGQE
jgi:uncharacterized DUF497 family protein